MLTNVMNFWVSLVWATGMKFLRALAERGWLQRVFLPTRVVSVGNLQVGGAGKTPLVMKIAREAIQRGKVVCILTRGHGRQGEGGVIAPGETPVDPVQFGDEPALIHERLPQVWLGVGSNRIQAYEWVKAGLGRDPDCVILDDGFQQYRLHRDVDILAITSARWGQKIFREFYSAARNARLLVWTKGEHPPHWVTRWNSGSVVRMQVKLQAPDSLAQKFWLVCGVADPQEVRERVQAAGYAVIRQIIFPDHARYAKPWVENLLAQVEREGVRILLTGKDAVKWKALGFSDRSWVTVEPEFEMIEGEAQWDSVLWG